MKYVRVYADHNGDSHFEDVEVEMPLADFAPPAPPLEVSPFMQAATVGFLGFPAEWDGPPHPVPRRQVVFILTGELEGAVSDGEVRHFPPGSIVLLEDTWGKGHASRNVSKDYGLLAVVQLPD